MDTKFRDRTSSHFRAVSFCLQNTQTLYLHWENIVKQRQQPLRSLCLFPQVQQHASEARLEVTVLACAHRVCDLG